MQPPHSHPAICVNNTKVLLSPPCLNHTALLNGHTDRWCCVSSHWGLCHFSPGEEKSYTHFHIAQLGLLFPVSRNQASPCTISVHCHHPAWPGDIVGFFPLPEFSIGDWSTGVRDLVLPASMCWFSTPVDFTEVFLRAKMWFANEHLLSGTLQSTQAHLNQHFAALIVTKISWSGNTTMKRRRWCFIIKLISPHLLLLSLLAAGWGMTIFPFTRSCFMLCLVSHVMF